MGRLLRRFAPRDDEKEGKAFCNQNNLLLRKIFKFFKCLIFIIKTTLSFKYLPQLSLKKLKNKKSKILQKSDNNSLQKRLNPCFNGRWTTTFYENRTSIHFSVSILVLMDNGLRLAVKATDYNNIVNKSQSLF